MPERTQCGAVLFDLDGTLVDTAPDLAWSLNEVCAQWGFAPRDYATIRSAVSHGSVALTKLVLDKPESDPDFKRFQQALLDTYQENIAQFSALFDGMDELLTRLEFRRIPWGIVTNKPAYLTNVLLDNLGLSARAQAIVSGDSASHPKPHPAPLLLAATQIGSAVEGCVYVGDAARDIIAGKAAGMSTLAARYGYLGDMDDPLTWGADDVVEAPSEITEWLGLN